MKRIFTLLVVLFASALVAQAQPGYYMIPHTYGPGNPGGLNTDDEFPVGGGIIAGWSSILPGSQATAAYSGMQILPFAFEFNGVPVSSYFAGSSGVVTFDFLANVIPAYGNNTFPNSDIPDQSICVLGLQGTGGNDHIVTKTFGTAPFQQHWIQFSSYSLAPNAACWTYWAVVLEETTNKIYIVDQRYANCQTTFNIGLKINSTTSVGPAGPVAPLAGTDAGAATNVYYEFIPGTQPATGGMLTTLNLTGFVFLNANNNISANMVNTGAQPITSYDFHYSVNNGTPLTQSATGANIASGSMQPISHSTPLVINAAGTYTIKTWVTNINGAGINTDTLTKSVDGLSSVIEDIIILEHFTNASCGPCASQNPAMETVMNANKLKIASVKYHVSWPGVDPMYSFNPGDPTARVNYHGVSGVPSVRLGNQANMSPGQVSQTYIDNNYTQMAPAFAYTVQTSIENNVLSVVGRVIRTRGINASDLRMHVIVVEDPVNYASAPGTNGEKDFPMVVRKLLPNPNGVALGTAEVSTDFNLTYPIPPVMLQDRLHVIVFVESAGAKVSYKGAKIKAGSSLWATSVQDQTLTSGKFEVYPNPAFSEANLSFDLKRNSEVMYEILDMSGKVIINSNLGFMHEGQHVQTIDVSNLSAGMYMVKAVMNDQVEVKRIVKH